MLLLVYHFIDPLTVWMCLFGHCLDSQLYTLSNLVRHF